MDTPLVRMIDASTNRAAEGLRVVEDFARFLLDDPHLTALSKELRHDLTSTLASIPAGDRLAARETQQDVGTAAAAADEYRRENADQVCAASFQRVKQSLRSLEEYSKLVDGDVARRLEALRYRIYTLERTFGLRTHSAERLRDARLLVLVDPCGSEAAFERLVSSLAEVGVHAIQLRGKELDDHRLLSRARILAHVCRGTRTLAFVNDRPDLAVLSGADGVHVGQDDLSVKDVRTIGGTQMLVGVSTHSMNQARAAVLDGAHYLGVGPVFSSSTKAFPELAGLQLVREVAQEIRLPWFAIGGIGPANIQEVLNAGARRVAVSAAVVRVANPAAAAEELLRRLDGVREDAERQNDWTTE